MNWQPHLKMRITDGKQTFQHNFMKSDPSENEIILAFENLKEKFHNNEKLIVSTGY